ncbi:MAG: two-component system sensor histidine kinase/response regulator [Myxococcota bacterium]|jgi:CheY-like chemotaxis protein/HPt (histidine-containing phosphotransfer) domain-containing protein
MVGAKSSERMAASDLLVHPGRSQRCVLVVEDNDVNAVILRRSLTNLGLDSHRAVDGTQALRALREFLFDAVLMDCQMLVMDGYEATQRIRATPSLAHLPVTAQSRMDDHLTKPVRLEELRAVLEAWVGPMQVTHSIAGQYAVNFDTLDRLRALLVAEFDATVRLFLTDAGGALTVVEEVFESGDWEQLGRAAHSLKSTSAYVGATSVSETCSRIVQQARDQKAHQMDAMLLGLRRGVEVASAALKDQLGRAH